MRHSETTLVAFLDGSLPRAQAEEFDRHLLECTECWTAVLEDQRGRLALERLNDPAPGELGDAISLAIGVQYAATEHHPRRGVRVLVGSATAAVLIAVTLLIASNVNAPPSPRDGFSAVAQLAAASSPARGRGHLVMLEGRRVLAVAHRVPAGTALVLTSTGPLSMPTPLGPSKSRDFPPRPPGFNGAPEETRSGTPETSRSPAMRNLLLPTTDGGVLTQTLIIVPLLVGLLVAVRRHAELRTFVLGVLVFTLGLMGLRTVH